MTQTSPYVSPLFVDEQLIHEWYDCFLAETKKAGYVATLDLYENRNKHNFYGLNDLSTLLNTSNKGLKDTYISLNAFDYGKRKIENLKQIRNIGVDLDFYKLGISIEKAVEAIKNKVIEGKLPNPNLLTYSGRGLQLIWTINGGASPAMEFHRSYIANQFNVLLKELNPDAKTVHAATVFRLPGSINSRNGATVETKIWNQREYSLDELYDYVTPYEKAKKSKKRKGKLLIFSPMNKDTERRIGNIYTLNSARLEDMRTLLQLREYDLDGYRAHYFYIFGFTQYLLSKDVDMVLGYAFDINSSLVIPLKERELRKYIKDSCKRSEEFLNHWIDNNFTVRFKTRDGIHKPMKNQTIIDLLDITEDEMKHFKTLIGKAEKQRRDTEKKRIKRGSITREEYEVNRKQNVVDKLTKLKEILAINPKVKKNELAKVLEIGRTRLYELLKMI
jgi:hypothetical protein